MLVIKYIKTTSKLLDVHLKFLGEEKRASVCNFDSIPFDHASRELNIEENILSKRRNKVPKRRVLFENF